MGLLSSEVKPTTIARTHFPNYAVKNIGTRHIVVAGGGGASRTGVKNEIQLFLLTYNQCSSLASRGSVSELRAKLISTVDTGASANMNLDVSGNDASGHFLVAAGQDQFCQIYSTNGYTVQGEDDEVESPSRLSLDLAPLARIRTDFGEGDSYQKCVRFDRSGVQPRRVATGSLDGYVRVWNVSDMLENRDPRLERRPLHELHCNGGEVVDLDFSFCGSTLAAITNKQTLFWDLQNERSTPLPVSEKIGDKFKARSIRFTTLGHKNIIFAVAYQQRQRTSKQNSFISLWSFSRERKTFNLVNLSTVKNDAISTIAVSPVTSSFIACGSMEGNFYCFETENLQCVYKSMSAHKKNAILIVARFSTFITSVDFLPEREVIRHASDSNVPPKVLPGPGCEAMISAVSVSADQTVKFHAVPFPQEPSLSGQMLKLGLQLVLVYLLAYLLFN